MSSVIPSQITRLLLKNHGSLEFKELSKNFQESSPVADQVLLKMISENDQFILIEDGKKNAASDSQPVKVVIAKTNLRICPDSPVKCKTCEDLHICRYFLCGKCTFGYLCSSLDMSKMVSSKKCKMSHDLKSSHNATVLGKMDLQALTASELFQLLLQNDETLLPKVCPHYNKGKGEHGGCKNESSCTSLHICQHFLQDDCKFGASCKRAHSFDTNSMKILIGRGLSEDAIQGFAKIYKNNFLISLHKSKPVVKAETAKASVGKNPASSNTLSEPSCDEICLFYIRRGCTFKEKCVRVHHNLPYKWQISEYSGKWRDLPNTEEIEKAYCNPANDTGPANVNFNSMTSGGSQVRRLSTASSANKPPHFILTTEWLWYWKTDKGQWIEYGQGDDGKNKALLDSNTVEKAFLNGERELQFRTDKHEYILHLQVADMLQLNVKLGTRRKVRRRPMFVSAQDVKRKLTSDISTSSCDDVPDHWDEEALPNSGYQSIALSKGMEEYRKVESLFRVTMSAHTIHSITRVQNPSLWRVFQWQKEQMKERNGGKDVDERSLFHGTDQSFIKAICDQNFDWRICGKHGTLYGKGSYFARDAKYSHGYAKSKNERKMMFMALVLVGKYTKGSSSYLRPPERKDKPGFFHDSCVDKEIDPSIFVIFEKYQVYPEYVIEYS